MCAVVRAQVSLVMLTLNEYIYLKNGCIPAVFFILFPGDKFQEINLTDLKLNEIQHRAFCVLEHLTKLLLHRNELYEPPWNLAG